MVISKRATKLMAFVLTFAFVIAGLVYVPKQAQAEDKKPTVNVLGATLRLDGKSGTQSLRFGIKISNASLAKDCGIVISAKGKDGQVKEFTVGTEAVEADARRKQHTEMYTVDKVKDEVVYCAVVTGIQPENYKKEFDIKGYVVPLDTGKADVKDVPEGKGKSVKGVVDVLNANDPDTITIDETTGDLVRIKEGGAVQKVTGTDLLFKKDGDMSPTAKTSIPVKLDTAVSADGKVRYDAEKKVVVIDDDAGSTDNSSVDFDLPSNIAPLEEVEITVKGKYSTEGTTGFRIWLGSGHNKSFQNNIKEFKTEDFKEEEFTVTFTAANECGQHNSIGYGGTTPATKLSVKPQKEEQLINGLTIESITVNYIDRLPDIKVGLGTINYKTEGAPGSESTVDYDETDDVLNIEFKGHRAILFNFNNLVSSDMIGYYKYVTVTYTSTKADDLQGYIADGKDEFNQGAEKERFTVEKDSVTYKAETSMNGLKIYDPDKADNISIKSIVLSHKEPEKAVKPIDYSKPPVYYKLDLSDESSYAFDGDGMTATYNNDTGMLDVSIAQYQGIIFKNSVDNVNDYKYVTFVYANAERAINSYIFDGEMGDEGKGRTPGGQKDRPQLSGAEEQKVTYNADKSMYGLKLVHVDWGYEDSISMSIKAIIFSDRPLLDEEFTEITGGGSSPSSN